MSIRALKYLAVYTTPILVATSIYFADVVSFLAVAFVFGLVPIVELFLKASTKNLTEFEEEIARKDKYYDFLLYSLVPIQYGLLIYFLIRVGDSGLAMYERIGLTTAFGISCGILGINAAHELGHRSTKYEQRMSKLLLLTTQYMHFFIEHNRGHHKNVSTEKDPASSRYGENLYSFYVRTVKDSWLSAWHLERQRLESKGLSFWSLHNEMLRFQILQVILLLSILVVFGWTTTGFYCLAAIIGFLLLETVNYIEHYGLQRKRNGAVYERTMPIHSWNSNHPLGRVFLLELSRHSDHHYIASRKYQLLRHFDESPQLPTGYPGMMLLSFCPPLWFSLMHKQIDKYKQTQLGDALA